MQRPMARRSIDLSQKLWGRSSSSSRRICSSSPYDTDALHNNSEILVEGKANSRIAILNRPSSLNALNTSMVHRLLALYQLWEHNPDIGFVALKGSGRAFCAGGDVVRIHHLISKGNLEASKEFFWVLNKFLYLLGTYLKPHVALLNGITMGGGAGVSVLGTFRVATDKTVFATPETLIGYHPDAGASFYLSHLPGHLGEYLALTGDKLKGEGMVTSGLATHYSNGVKLPLIEQQLGELSTDNPSVIESSLCKFDDLFNPGSMNAVIGSDVLVVSFPGERITAIASRNETLDTCFGHETVEEIIDSLENEAGKTNDPWCISTLKRLKYASPLSLKVSLRSIREARFQTLDQCLIREYRLTVKGISKQISGDFSEGVRALLVDKDFAPKWDPPSLEQVSPDMVDQFFSPLNELGPELDLPTKQREAFT